MAEHCLSSHEACNRSSIEVEINDSKGSQLPSRVLDVGKSIENSNLRLITLTFQVGRWIALSHCWGNSEQRPLRTTKSNLDAHCNGIQMGKLTKTFQDAVQIARALGIRFLWIDSLCIVQDDSAELSREIRKMGEIYAKATLTIAAGHAQNSSEGCFSNDFVLRFEPNEDKSVTSQEESRGQPPETERKVQAYEDYPDATKATSLPFFKGKKIVAFFSVSPRLVESYPDQKPLKGLPLFRRAWVMQEWALSRRTLIFRKDSILWSCRELCEDESGNILNLSRPSLCDWESLIKVYTDMALTYESDRLPAIKGISEMLEKYRGGHYFAGMWCQNFPDCLLWKVCGSAGGRSPQNAHLPSWAWPSTQGKIGFQLSGIALMPRYSNGQPVHSRQFLENAFHVLNIKPSGVLRFKGFMSHLGNFQFEFVARSKMKRMRYKSQFKQNFKGYSNCRQGGGSIYGEQMVMIPSDDPCSVLYYQRELAGWGALDEDRIPESSTVYCLALKRERFAMIPDLKRRFIENVYHVLLVRSVPFMSKPERYARIGMGVVAVSGQQWQATDAEIV